MTAAQDKADAKAEIAAEKQATKDQAKAAAAPHVLEFVDDAKALAEDLGDAVASITKSLADEVDGDTVHALGKIALGRLQKAQASAAATLTLVGEFHSFMAQCADAKKASAAK